MFEGLLSALDLVLFFESSLFPSDSNMGRRYSLTTKAAISGVIIDLENF
jgi:hypothetical protein